MHRTENSLEIWILEAKGIPMKREYYCEICLDKTLYARTSVKPRSDICFWGEHFFFSPTPHLKNICVNLYREANAKKKKDRSTLIGFISIEINQLSGRHPIEKWYPVTTTSDGSKLLATKDRCEGAAVRIKARFQSVQILPMHLYCDLLSFLKSRYLPLCRALEPVLSVKAKEYLATGLVRIMHKQQSAKHFLCDLIMSEVEDLDNEHLMFRGNSLATKAMEAFMKLVADFYLQNTLGDFVWSIQQSDKNFEVDPLKLSNAGPGVLDKNRHQLVSAVEAAWTKIINSVDIFPTQLRDIFIDLRQRLMDSGRMDLGDMLISSSIFLRFLCPAILSPSLFNLVSEYPTPQAARNLTLVAKTLQNLANFTKFGGKEHYMEFMNDFVEREWENMHCFLIKISSFNSATYLAANDCGAAIDMGKELSLLYTYLDELWTQQVQKQSCEVHSQLDELRLILSKLRYSINEINANTWNQSNSFTLADSACDCVDLTNWRMQKYSTFMYTNNDGAAIESKAVSSSKPASHLHLDDDHLMDFGLLNDNFAMQQAGIAVQKHRNHRHAVEHGPVERNTHAIAERDRVDHSSNAHHIDAATLSNTPNAGRNSPNRLESTANGSYERTEDDSGDSSTDVAYAVYQCHSRPSRRIKRRIAISIDGNDRTAICNKSAIAASSSGYQSQIPSSSVSSSNSSSPVERKILENNVTALKQQGPLLQNHISFLSSPKVSPSSSFTWSTPNRCYPFTDSSSHQLTSSEPSTMLKNKDIRQNLTRNDGVGMYDVTKSSIPRTNPHCTGRSSSTVGTQMNNWTAVDDKRNCKSMVKSNVPQIEVNDRKCYCWDVPFSYRGQVESCRINQQDIIERQKREIKRLMIENEELKRRLAMQKSIESIHRRSTITSGAMIERSASTDFNYNSPAIPFHNNVNVINSITHC